MHGDPTYREFSPPPALRPFVACFWQRVAPASQHPVVSRVLPDGCVDLLFEANSGAALLVGTMTRAHEFVAAAATDLVAVRLQPGALRHLVRADACEFNDGHVDLIDVARDWRDARERLLTGAPERRLAALQNELRRRTVNCRLDAIDDALARWTRQQGPVRIDELATRLCISRQWLGRQVTARTGLSPRRLARVLRFSAAASDLRAGRPAAAVACDHGYADQAHLCRDVREFAGTTPSQLVD